MIQDQTTKEVGKFYRSRIKAGATSDHGRLMKEDVFAEYKKFCKAQGFMASEEPVFWRNLREVVGSKELASRTILARDAEKNRKRAIVGWSLRE